MEKIKDFEESQHPVWKILKKDRYVKESWKFYEDLYDFIDSLTKQCDESVFDGHKELTMRHLFNLWNEHSAETFAILDYATRSNVSNSD